MELNTRFNFAAKAALVYTILNDSNTEPVLELWEVPAATPGKQKRIFIDEKGQKAILENQGDRFFTEKAKQADNCSFIELWYGAFPYDSWGWGIQYIPAQKRYRVVTLRTEINNRGQSQTAQWRDECRTYTP